MELPLDACLQRLWEAHKARGRRPQPAPAPSEVYSVLDLRRGDLVRLEGLARAEVRDKPKDIAVALEGSLAYVKREANELGEVVVTPRNFGGELVLSGHFLLKCDYEYRPSASPWSEGEAVRAAADAAPGRVVRVGGDGAVWVQSDLDARVVRSAALLRLAEEEKGMVGQKRCMDLTLLPFQWRAVDVFMERGRCLGVFPMGSGKTVLGLACVCRSLGSLPEEVRAGFCVLVLAPRKTVPMWEAELRHLRGDLREQVRLVTYEGLAGAMHRCASGSGAAFRWRHERQEQAVSFVYMDEFHDHRNAGARSEDVAALLAQVPRAAGVTATPVSTDLEQVANQCRLLGLEPVDECDLQSAEFWRQPDAFHLAQLHPRLVWLDEAEVKRECAGKFPDVPPPLPDHEVRYAGCGFKSFSVTSHLDAVLAEHFGLEGGAQAKRHMAQGREAFMSFCCAELRRPLRSKLASIVETLAYLFEGRINATRHRKVVVGFHHPCTGWLLAELLRTRATVYRYFSDAAERDPLPRFLEDESPRVVLLLAVAVGGTGLNLVRRETSPTAVVRFEMADSQLTDGQLIGRCVRPGQIYAVQPVRLVGEGTVNGWRWAQIQRHTERVERSGVRRKRAASPAPATPEEKRARAP